MNFRIPFLFLLLFLSSNCRELDRKREMTSLILEDPARVSYANQFTTGKNYLTISQPEIKHHTSSAQLRFSLSWDASWRSVDLYDAAWVFAKYKDAEGRWHHATLDQTGSAATVDQGNQPEIRISPDGVGCMVYRAADGEGNNNWSLSLSLKGDWQVQPAEFKVYGLEMVHVGAGPFEAGTLKGERARGEVLTPGAGGAPYDPLFTYKSGVRDNYGGIFKVTSEDPINIGKEDGNLYWIDANIPGTNTFSGIPEGILEADFPKGTRAFYQMKYELSQQEYCDFLNSLTPKQQKARDFTTIREYNRPISDYRNAIVYENGTYTTNRPNRPCNFLSWLDGQAYADWAGLRHMTELEFEKSCRGPERAIYREYVWGVNELEDRQNMRYVTRFLQEDGNLAGSESGHEYCDGNIHASMFSYFNIDDVCKPNSRFYDPSSVGCRGFTGGDGGRGPVRKGIFGMKSGGDRIKAGATYYGAMEMGGNLQEPVVAVGHPSGRKFRGTHGDGHLSPDGLATNEDWQPINGEYAFGGRGGCWKFHENHARTSDRFKGLRQSQNRRASHIGFRGVRTGY